MRALAAVAALLVPLAGCAEDARGVFVEIHDRTYAPDALTIGNGTAVEYRNVDDEEHTVTVATAGAPDLVLDEEVLAAGERREVAFAEPGAFIVYCRYHGDPASGQRMDVVVT